MEIIQNKIYNNRGVTLINLSFVKITLLSKSKSTTINSVFSDNNVRN